MFPENAQEDDLKSLEELEIVCKTIQEQLEFNNNWDKSVVRSYEEKKKLVSAWCIISVKFGEKIGARLNNWQWGWKLGR